MFGLRIFHSHGTDTITDEVLQTLVLGPTTISSSMKGSCCLSRRTASFIIFLLQEGILNQLAKLIKHSAE